MTELHRNNPLHGIKLESMLIELVEQYGWEILAAQIKVNCFKSYPSIKSSEKFLRKTQWAREKTEAFYLYRYKQLPRPDDEQHALPPRERSFDADLEPQLPAIITETDKEFFDDPLSGPIFHKQTRPRAGRKQGDANNHPSKAPADGETPDPWAKWKEKNK